MATPPLIRTPQTSRIPQRSPMTRPLGGFAVILRALSDTAYVLHLDSRVSQHPTGFYSGARVLSPGERVTATWREESRSFMITGVGSPPFKRLGDFTPLVSADDGFWSEDQSSFNSGGSTLTLYGSATASLQRHVFIRFPGIPLAQGTKIGRAVVRFQKGALSNSPVATIYLNDVDDAVAPTTAAGADGKALTAASASWTFPGSNPADAVFETPNFAAAVQEVVDRGSWAADNALMVIIKASTSGGEQGLDSFDDAGDFEPVLLIDRGDPVLIPTEQLTVADLGGFDLDDLADVSIT